MVLACQSPTSIAVEVTIDFACSDFRGATVTVGSQLGAAFETQSATTTSHVCNAGYVGTVVVVPRDSNDADVSIRVVGGLGRRVEDCTSPYVAGCVVARRELHFSPHVALAVPVVLRAACNGVSCSDTETCVKGGCANASLSGDACSESCDESVLVPPSEAGADAGEGGSGHDAEAGSGDASSPDAGLLDQDAGPPTRQGMVFVQTPAGSFFIDAHETTNAEYTAFVNAKNGDTSGQPPECSWNDSFLPRDTGSNTSLWPYPAGHEKYPAAGVDWCDAYAYCKWANKRLCGKIGGGAEPFDKPDDATTGQWVAACTGNGAHRYPYGDAFVPGACNANNGGMPGFIEVGSLTTCQGGFDGLFDMAGNVEEWEDACSGTTGAGDICHRRGGSSYDSPADQLSLCGRPYLPEGSRSESFIDLGLRCCADL